MPDTLRASEIRYRRLFESARDGILILDAETGMVTDANPYLLELLGFSRTEVLQKKVWELGFLRDVVANEDRFAELRQTKYVRYDNLALEGEDGRRHEVEFISNVYPEGSHEVIQCNIRDISERKRNEAKVRHLMQVLRAVRNVNQLIVHAKDRDTLLCQACQILTDTRGYRSAWIALLDAAGSLRVVADSGIGEALDAFRSSLSAERWPDCCRRALEGDGMVVMHHTLETCATCLLECRSRDTAGFAAGLRHGGRDYGVLVVALPQNVADDPQEQSLFQELAGDIGYALHSLRAEAEQRSSERTLRAMFDGMHDGILLADIESRRFLNANGTMCRLLGYTLEEIRGLSLEDIHPPESLERVANEFGRQARGEIALAPSIPVLRKDGSVFPADVNATALEIDGRRCLLGVFRDITPRLRLESQLHQAQKMESIGRLAGGVAHDFNNLLMGIMGYTELCLEKVGPDHPIVEWLDEILHEAQRSASLTRQLLAFARKQTIEPQLLDLNDTISGILKLLHRLIGEDITLAWIPGTDVWPIQFDPGQIDQILANLCVNARDAIGSVGRLTIETENTVIDGAYCAEHPEAAPGDYAMLAVSDDGCGMDHETLARVFEPFFTTKPAGQGTGLGLATVYGIVKQNGGFVNVYSEPGNGSTFRVYLPRCQGAVAASAVPQVPATGLGGTETILLVEDEKSIRLSTALFLGVQGYTVLTAADPEEALCIAGEHPGPIHLLITDVVLPGMNGRDLAGKLSELYPRMKHLFISGYTADVIAHRGLLKEGMHFLAKPFTHDVIARKVCQVLKGEHTPGRESTTAEPQP